jgi:uncharacterized protein (DUF1778 family)
MSAVPNGFEEETRINFRLDASKKQLIEQAAAAKGLTLTQFATSTLCREAKEVLESDQILVLANRDRDEFLAALDNPPAPSEKLLRAAAAYKVAKSNGRITST